MATLEMLPPGELEVEGVEWKEECTTLAIKPIFYGNGREPSTAGLLKVKDGKGQLVHMYTIRMNGKDLSLSLLDRTAAVKPMYERVKGGS